MALTRSVQHLGGSPDNFAEIPGTGDALIASESILRLGF